MSERPSANQRAPLHAYVNHVLTEHNIDITIRKAYAYTEVAAFLTGA